MNLLSAGSLFVLCLALLAGLASCSPAKSPSTPTRVNLQLMWNHTNTFGGYYAADQNGYYAAEGIAVTFREGGPKVDYFSPVIEGTAQFGDGGSDELILSRAAGKPLRAVATIYGAARWSFLRWRAPGSPGLRILWARPSGSLPVSARPCMR